MQSRVECHWGEGRKRDSENLDARKKESSERRWQRLGFGVWGWIPTEPSHIGWKGKGIHPAQRINIGYASPVLSSCEHSENLVFFSDYSQEC